MSGDGLRLLLLGANGQLGRAFIEVSKTDSFPIGWILTALGRADLDYSDPDQIAKGIRLERPDVILNCAAYTAVDRAESEQDLSEKVNARAPAVLAEVARELGALLIHFSSDYVYSGSGAAPHFETEIPAPLNHYGATKARGDQAILDSGCDALIFRTSWVYSHEGSNFLKTMLRLSREQPEIRVVSDQIGSPTYAPDLARTALQAMMRALETRAEGKPFPGGVYHLTNSGHTSWAGFARAILGSYPIVEIQTCEYPTPARRPLNSRLNLAKIETTFGIKPRSWKEALDECMKRLRSE